MINEINSPQEALVLQLLENRDALCAFLYMHLRNWHDTEDLFQEVTLVIMRKANEELEIRNFNVVQQVGRGVPAEPSDEERLTRRVRPTGRKRKKLP